MKINKKKVSGLLLLILIIVIGLAIFFENTNKTIESNNENLIENMTTENTTIAIDNEFSNMDKNTVEYKEDSNVEELKKTTGAEGESNIYEVQTEFDGRKVLSVKNSVRLKTAFAGMIKKEIPKKEELDDIYNKYYPNKNGIWIEENSRNKILDLLNNGTDKYNIDNDGYLYIKERSSKSDADKKIEKTINGNKTVIIDISSICYTVDDMTGNILDYNFEEMDKYQTYEYFEDNGSLIIFINENKDNQLTKNEIINSMVELF